MPNNSNIMEPQPSRKNVGRTLGSQGHRVLIHETFVCDFVSKGTMLCDQIEALPKV